MRALRNVVVLLFLLSGSMAYAQLWDDGIQDGTTRTEYEPGRGSADLPLTLRYDHEGVEGCKFDAAETFSGCPGRAGIPPHDNGLEVWQGNLHWNEACGGDRELLGDTWRGCLEYRRSNYFADRVPRENYWVLIANNDPSFDQCNSGPPGISHPVSSPVRSDRGLFQFFSEKYLDREYNTRYRMHFVLSSDDHDFYCESLGRYQSSIPFISVGAQNGAGNGGPVGRFSTADPEPEPSGENDPLVEQLSFEFEVVGHEPYSCLPETRDTCLEKYAGSHAGIYLLSEWGGTDRMLFVELWRTGYFASPGYGTISARWNWPIEQSIFYPGAEVAVLPVGHPDLEQCELGLKFYSLYRQGKPMNYQVDVGALYRCAETLGLFSGVMPSEPVDLDGVHWFSETYGTSGFLWVSVARASMGSSEHLQHAWWNSLPQKFSPGRKGGLRPRK